MATSATEYLVTEAMDTDEFTEQELFLLAGALYEANSAAGYLLAVMDVNQELLDDCLRMLRSTNAILRWSNEFAASEGRQSEMTFPA